MKCASCDDKVGLTQECLRQCAPVDAIDNACAKHKECNLLKGDEHHPIPGCTPGALSLLLGSGRVTALGAGSASSH